MATDIGSAAEPRLLNRFVYDTLRESIMTGRFVPGRSVTLRGLAADLGVSPTPVREAIRQLVSERALAMLDNRRLAIPAMTPAKFEEICRARRLLEPELAVSALPHVTAATLQAMRQADAVLDRALAAKDADAYMRANFDFHFTLYGCSPNRTFFGLVESLWLQVGPFMRSVVERFDPSAAIDEHERALAAIAAGDSAALASAIDADIEQGAKIVGEVACLAAHQRNGAPSSANGRRRPARVATRR